jgi:endonuclease/exonuclease/phosphatase family metal-dependent hydrolase
MSYTDGFMQTSDKSIETDRLIAILKEKRHAYVLTGDFNAEPGSYTINEIEKRLKNAGPGMEEKTWTTKLFSYKGFEANKLDWRLDYCFATPDIEIKSAKIIKTDYSDHLPILLKV